MSTKTGQVVLVPAVSTVIVISGPGGVGKGTLVEALLQRDERLWVSKSWTTRAPRLNESATAYHFATRQAFEAHIEAGGFLEWTEFLDYLQGSPVPQPPEGKDVLFEIDVQGAANVKARYPEALLIFVDAPNRDVQEARLRLRGDSEDRILQRLEKAHEEIDRASKMEFVHLVNDDLLTSVQELQQLIEQHRSH